MIPPTGNIVNDCVDGRISLLNKDYLRSTVKDQVADQDLHAMK